MEKQVLSISLGSKSGDHGTTQTVAGVAVRIERRGTDGNHKEAQALFRKFDGRVDAFGLGGADIFLQCNGIRYELRDGRRLAGCAKRTPVVDGSGLKDTLEREAAWILASDGPMPIAGQRVLVLSGMDRFGLSETLVRAGCGPIVFGDKIFCLNINEPITSLAALDAEAKKLMPELSKLPISLLYPMGTKQDQPPEVRHPHYFTHADIICGDRHLICRYMPDNLSGKTVITNTNTAWSIDQFRKRGVRWLVSTTPSLDGRNFGTNVLEAVFVALLGKPLAEITNDDYLDLLKQVRYEPHILRLNE